MATAAKSRSRKPKAEVKPDAGNPVVARRLAFLPDAKRKAAAKRFAEGEPIATLAEELGLSVTHAAYSLRQQLVEDGTVPRIKGDDVEAIKAALADGDDKFNDWHWLACRTGMSTGRVKNLVG